MAKRNLAIVVIAVLAASGIFAQEEQEETKKPKTALGISAGVGGFIGGDFGGGMDATVKMTARSVLANVETPYFGGGGYAFFDATYAELSVSFYSGSGKLKQTTDNGEGSNSIEKDLSIMSLNIGLLGKYPFHLNTKMSVFPLLGIDYQAVLSAKIDDKDENPVSFGEDPKKIASSDFSALWFKLGGGMDFAITEKLYLRCEALYGIRLANKYETDLKDMVDKAVKNMKDNDPDAKSDVKTLLGHGLTVKLAVGYRF